MRLWDLWDENVKTYCLRKISMLCRVCRTINCPVTTVFKKNSMRFSGSILKTIMYQVLNQHLIKVNIWFCQSPFLITAFKKFSFDETFVDTNTIMKSRILHNWWWNYYKILQTRKMYKTTRLDFCLFI